MLKVVAVIAVLMPWLSVASGRTGEHFAYTVGCVNCHHQTPKEIIYAPPLTIVKSYSLPAFRRLMKAGVTRSGRNPARRSIQTLGRSEPSSALPLTIVAFELHLANAR